MELHKCSLLSLSLRSDLYGGWWPQNDSLTETRQGQIHSKIIHPWIIYSSRNTKEQLWQELPRMLHHGTWPSVRADHSSQLLVSRRALPEHSWSLSLPSSLTASCRRRYYLNGKNEGKYMKQAWPYSSFLSLCKPPYYLRAQFGPDSKFSIEGSVLAGYYCGVTVPTVAGQVHLSNPGFHLASSFVPHT